MQMKAKEFYEKITENATEIIVNNIVEELKKDEDMQKVFLKQGKRKVEIGVVYGLIVNLQKKGKQLGLEVRENE